jgi:hypothetical protein
MKKAAKGKMKMSATKKADAKDTKTMSPQDKFKAMIAAKKAAVKGKMKMSYGAMKKGAKKK